jgi:hypothetical protein
MKDQPNVVPEYVPPDKLVPGSYIVFRTPTHAMEQQSGVSTPVEYNEDTANGSGNWVVAPPSATMRHEMTTIIEQWLTAFELAEIARYENKEDTDENSTTSSDDEEDDNKNGKPKFKANDKTTTEKGTAKATKAKPDDKTTKEATEKGTAKATKPKHDDKTTKEATEKGTAKEATKAKPDDKTTDKATEKGTAKEATKAKPDDKTTDEATEKRTAKEATKAKPDDKTTDEATEKGTAKEATKAKPDDKTTNDATEKRTAKEATKAKPDDKTTDIRRSNRVKERQANHKLSEEDDEVKYDRTELESKPKPRTNLRKFDINRYNWPNMTLKQERTVLNLDDWRHGACMKRDSWFKNALTIHEDHGESPDDVVITGPSIVEVVTRSDFASLGLDMLIRGSIINNYFAIHNQRELILSRWDSDRPINFFSTTRLMDMLLDKDNKGTMKGTYFKRAATCLQFVDVTTINTLYIPVHAGIAHWVLVMVDIPNMTIYALDPYKTESRYGDLTRDFMVALHEFQPKFQTQKDDWTVYNKYPTNEIAVQTGGKLEVSYYFDAGVISVIHMSIDNCFF